MAVYKAPLKDINFVLNEVLDVSGLAKLPGYEDATPDTIQAILEEAAKLCENVLFPLNRSGDEEGCHYENGVVRTIDEAVALAQSLGYPVLVRPSYVLGGQAMKVAYSEASLRQFAREAMAVSEDRPLFMDRFLRDAIEVDVDVLCDGEDTVVGGVMEHIEEAGIHSGD